MGRLLAVLEDVERQMSEIYTWLGAGQLQDSEAANLFAELAKEEERHLDLVAMQRRLVANTEIESQLVGVSAQAVAQFGHLTRDFRLKHPEPTLEEALRFAIYLEMQAADSLVRRVAQCISGKLGEFFQALLADYEDHSGRLRSFRARYETRRTTGSAG